MARPRDWAIAAGFLKQGIELATVTHALRLATLRRHCRDPALDPLEPIHSLAYLKLLVEHLHRTPHDPDYAEYVRWSYEKRIDIDLLKDLSLYKFFLSRNGEVDPSHCVGLTSVQGKLLEH